MRNLRVHWGCRGRPAHLEGHVRRHGASRPDGEGQPQTTASRSAPEASLIDLEGGNQPMVRATGDHAPPSPPALMPDARPARAPEAAAAKGDYAIVRSTARFTTTATCARELEAEGWSSRRARTPRCCSRATSPGARAYRDACAACSRSPSGTAPPASPLRARLLRHQAALPHGAAGCGRPAAHLRLRDHASWSTLLTSALNETRSSSTCASSSPRRRRSSRASSCPRPLHDRCAPTAGSRCAATGARSTPSTRDAAERTP